VKRVIAFSQYPQYSCSTTGSSINSLAKHLCGLPADHPLNQQVHWSLIDRWPLNQGLVQCFADLIQTKMKDLPAEVPSDRVVLLFSAHSLPQYVSKTMPMPFMTHEPEHSHVHASPAPSAFHFN
jgi:ferrochelatase